MLNLEDSAFRFYQSSVERLFNEIRSSACLRIDVPENLEDKLQTVLGVAARFCTMEWDCNHPVLYRARKNDYGQLKPFRRRDMGPPKPHMSSDGRAQLAGVSLLYVADTESTAIAEVRPEVGEFVTTGTFRLKRGRSLKVLDLNRFHHIPDILHREQHPDPLGAYSRFALELSDLHSLSRRAFSAPLHPAKPMKYYAHAYFVQKVRELGYDGVGYESAVHSPNRCFAFFDVDNFRCTRTSLHRVTTVSLTSERVQFSLAERKYIAQQDALKH